eukprot:SAG11_NODE_563_length_8516_cov_11.669122_3_plen_57_part_00
MLEPNSVAHICYLALQLASRRRPSLRRRCRSLSQSNVTLGRLGRALWVGTPATPLH